jgi:hypothetical protein
MSNLGDLREMIEEARAELLAAVDGCTESEEQWDAVRDLLWRAGYREDWRRRLVKQGLEGGAAPTFEDRLRPSYVASPEALLAWLDQTRRPVLSLLRRMTEDDLRRTIAMGDDGTSTPRTQIEAIAADEQELAAQVRALRELTNDKR